MSVDETVDVDESADVDEVCTCLMYDCISVYGCQGLLDEEESSMEDEEVKCVVSVSVKYCCMLFNQVDGDSHDGGAQRTPQVGIYYDRCVVNDGLWCFLGRKVFL